MKTYDDNVRKRLRRVEGQVRGVLQMMEDCKDCKEVVAQLSAVRGAVDKAIAYIVAGNLSECIARDQGSSQGTERLVHEAVELLIKSR
jgi:DNA-binding FrmR family transcriptional regulator